MSVAWVMGDTVYGRSTALRRWLEDRGQHHVLAVPRNESLWVSRDIWTPKAMHAVHEGQEWYRLSTDAGNKGERWYDWQPYVAFTPKGYNLETLVVGSRWCIEHAFEAAKQKTGLDDYEMRSAVGWYRHITLALWALALLAVVRAADLARPDPKNRVRDLRARGLAEGWACPRSGTCCGACGCGCRPRSGRSWPDHTGTAVTSGWRRAAATTADNHNQLTYNCSIDRCHPGHELRKCYLVDRHHGGHRTVSRKVAL